MMNDILTHGSWHRAIALKDVPEGEPVSCQVGSREITIYLVDGTFYATSNVCTHALALLSDGVLDGYCVECPLHYGRFDIRTGEAVSSPAEVDLETYPARVVGDHIEIFCPPD